MADIGEHYRIVKLGLPRSELMDLESSRSRVQRLCIWNQIDPRLGQSPSSKMSVDRYLPLFIGYRGCTGLFYIRRPGYRFPIWPLRSF